MNSAPAEDPVRRLIDAAQRAHSAGRSAEAAQLIEQARVLSPEHPLVLNAVGMRLLSSGDAAGARKVLEQAVGFAPDVPALRFSLALCLRALGDADAEMAAVDKALALDPYFFLALLQKATLLERLGNMKRASTAYQAVLACAPPAAQLPPALQAALVHANKVVSDNTHALEAFLSSRIDSVRLEHRGERQDRFDDCLDAMLGKKRIFVQQPTFMNFPSVPAIQFYDRADFPWLEAYESFSEAIRLELTQLLAQGTDDFVPYVAHPDGTPLNQWKALNRSRRWSAFFLWKEGAPIHEHLAKCPATVEALKHVPRVEVPGHAPTVFFSMLEPKTQIPAHTGVTNTRLVVHLPLIVPPGCRFRVGSDTREWQPGRAWIFDDTIEHEAWNDSDEPRALLICDIWNPFLTEAERALVTAVTAGIHDFYGADLPAAANL